MRPLLKKKVTQKVDGGRSIEIGFSRSGNKHLYSDAIGRSKNLKKSDLKELDKALGKSRFVRAAPLSKPRKDGISKFYYFKDARKGLYYNVAEVKKGKHVSRFVYSVTDRIK